MNLGADDKRANYYFYSILIIFIKKMYVIINATKIRLISSDQVKSDSCIL